MEYPHPAAAKQYAKQVVAGEIPAGKYHRLACQRFLDDLERKDLDYRGKAAQRVCQFIESLPHVSGIWRQQKKKITMEPVQSFIVCNIFGFYDWDGDRRFNEAFILMPRKNAKSTLAAAIGLYMLCADGESAPEVYAGASNEAQAFKVFGPAREMVRMTPEMKTYYGLETPVKSILKPNEYGAFKPIIGKPGDGDSASCAIADELHEHDNNHLVEAMKLGMGARRNPLMLSISTAGSNLAGPCYERCSEVQKLLEGTYQDDSIFGVIFHADEEDQWDTEEALIKANPLWGISKNSKNTLKELVQARRSASLQNSFKTKHLNLWVGASVSWMNMLAWQRQKRDMKMEDFAGRRAILSIDLASKLDLSVINILIPDGRDFYTFSEFFAPQEAVENNDTYSMYRENITVTPGNATEYEQVEQRISELAVLFDVIVLGFDQWQAQNTAQNLQKAGLNVMEFPQNRANLSAPMHEVETMVISKRLFHDGNPVQTWCMGNTVAHADIRENIMPAKERRYDKKCKIDGAVALIMSMGLFLSQEDRGSLEEWLADPVAMS